MKQPMPYWYYRNGSMANIHATVSCRNTLNSEHNRNAGGTITIHAPFYKSTSISMTKNGEYEGGGKRFGLPYGANGFEFEIREVMNCLEKGKTESDLLPLDFSLRSSEGPCATNL